MSDKPLTDIPFSEFELHPQLLAGLEAAGFVRCTPIQAMTLPVALPGGDVAGQAQTGTGKTLAFLVAVINRLLTRPALADRKPGDPRALILAPTRELAIQIHKDAVKLGPELGLKFALVYGGVDYDKQRAMLQEGVDVIIATPGRLIDYVKQHKVVSLHACEICVLDEADRMFDLGFIKDIRFLLRRMPVRTERQTLLYSATLSHRVLELAYEHMNEPEKMVVETESITAARVRQKMYYPSDEEKLPLLLGLLSRNQGARTMVFVNTKVFVERVARALERAGYRVGVLSGDVPQKKRESLLKRFQAGQLEILVATDVAARGLHIDGVEFVFNYDLPFDAEDYVHRIGRTARLGREGDAISFACERYAMGLPDIEAFIEQKIPSEPVTEELLKPLPRQPREGVDAEGEGESVGEIFREAREQRAAEEARRGGGRPGGGRTGGRGGDGERRRRAPRDDRPARAQEEGEQIARPAPAAEGQPAEAPAADAPAPRESAAGGTPDDASRPPRRRRRRGGRRGQGQGEGNHQGQANENRQEAQAASDSSQADAPAAEHQGGQSSGPQDDAARPPRKRRRRRGGRRANGGEGAGQAAGERQGGNGQQPGQGGSEKPAQPRPAQDQSAAAATPAKPPAAQRKGPRQVPAKAPAPAADPSDSGGLISRIGRGLKKLVSRDPA